MCAPLGFPCRHIADIDDDGATVDRVRRVATARLAFIDHALLRHDFPQLAGSGPEADRRRESWLLDNAAVISESQSAANVVNDAVYTVGPAREVWRPVNYERAVVAPVMMAESGGGGMLDIKGAGVRSGRTPSLRDHSSGLCQLREAFRELLFARAIERAFRRSGSQFWTLPVYGVVDFGFDARSRHGESVPAGLLVRRAHRRHARGSRFPFLGSREERLHFEIELFLRHYGITSCHRFSRLRVERRNGALMLSNGAGPVAVSEAQQAELAAYFADVDLPAEYEALNIQLARLDPIEGVRAQLVDFGHYEVRPQFAYSLISHVHGGIGLGAKLGVTDPAFVQPDRELCLPQRRWGIDAELASRAGTTRRSLTARPWLWTDALAKDFRAGRTDARGVASALQEYLDDDAGEPR